jgi:hypothetical protein
MHGLERQCSTAPGEVTGQQVLKALGQRFLDTRLSIRPPKRDEEVDSCLEL